MQLSMVLGIKGHVGNSWSQRLGDPGVKGPGPGIATGKIK